MVSLLVWLRRALNELLPVNQSEVAAQLAEQSERGVPANTPETQGMGGEADMMTREQDIRVGLLNSLLTTPHRDLAQVWPVHRDIVSKDPRFYVQLAAWYCDQGDVRDHKEMFVITLCLSDFPGHRDVGLAMLRELPPYQLVRVVDFIHGRKKTRKLQRSLPEPRGRRARRRARATPAVETTEQFGLFRNPPRSLRTEVVRYLREREMDADWFDGTVLASRQGVKRLYALLHVKPGVRAQKILFDRDPPKDSRIHALRMLAQAKEPAEQARAILEHRIPYRVASTVVKRMTPTVLLALIDRMSPQELINNLGSLKKRGALNNEDLKALIDEKLEAARTGPRVSALKTSKAADAIGDSPEMKAKLDKVADSRVKAKGRIARPTALLIDKSSSMEQSIELGKRIGAMLSAICESALYVYAFDTMAYVIDGGGEDMASWERALKGISAGGATSCGVPLTYMLRRKEYAEQIIIVTDECENSEPAFVDALKRYRERMNADPNICIVRIGNQVVLEERCKQAGIAVDVFPFSGDYYALPNLVPMISKPSKLELLMEIMEYPLPKRKEVCSV